MIEAHDTKTLDLEVYLWDAWDFFVPLEQAIADRALFDSVMAEMREAE